MHATDDLGLVGELAIVPDVPTATTAHDHLSVLLSPEQPSNTIRRSRITYHIYVSSYRNIYHIQEYYMYRYHIRNDELLLTLLLYV